MVQLMNNAIARADGLSLTEVINNNIFELPTKIDKNSEYFGSTISLPNTKSCLCPPNHLNCQTAKEWLKSQLEYGSSVRKAEMSVIRKFILQPEVDPEKRTGS